MFHNITKHLDDAFFPKKEGAIKYYDNIELHV